ncbi:hypothetical protein [Prevotella sp.]|uniref:hypothetical protein n=1 Tax=Prevotella sp. TaxID=59823 RepID=UPI003DA5D2CD
MRNKRRQERFALSRFALPVTAIYGALATLAAGVIEQELWLQTTALFAATIMMVFMNNRYSLIRVYSRMVSCSYLVLMTMATFLFPSIHGAIIEVAFIAACMFLFNAYQNPHGAGAVFYAFAMIGISSIFFVQILYYVPILWFILATNILALSTRTIAASIIGLIIPYWFVAGYYASTGNMQAFIDHFCDLAKFGKLFDYSMINNHQAVTFIFIAILGITGTIHFLRNSYNDKIKTRMLYESFIAFEIATIVFTILQPQHFDFLLRILIISTAALIGHFITLTHTWITNIAFHLIIVITLLITAYNLWMPSLTF